MSAPPYMKLYVADYLGDTHHLGALEHGAYLLLLMAMWRAGGSLPGGDANLARMARCSPEEWSEIRDVILPFFKRSRGRLTHKRIAEEIAKYENTSGKRSEAGKRGAAKKASKNKAANQAIASFAESNCRHNQNQNQNHIYSEDKSSAREPVEVDLDALAWQTAVQVLTEQGGCQEPEARRLFGKLLASQKLQARDMLPTLSAALVNRTQDPKAYITKAAANVAKRRVEASAPAKRVSFV